MERLPNGSMLIDGSYGEGGGQILRVALALSAILKIPVTIHHIRAGRKNPGLQPQHRKAVEALAKITGAQTEGLATGSQSIAFAPRSIQGGDYKFEIGTAGSVTLLVQSLLLPLCFSRRRSRLTLAGGTHVPWSPPYHYLAEVLVPTLRNMGIKAEVMLDRWGWYPKGAGIVRIEIDPVSEIKPLMLLDRGPLKRIRGISASCRLPKHVAEKQREAAMRGIEGRVKADVEIRLLQDVPGNGPGSFLFVVAESEGAIAGFSSLGERGKRAEDVAKDAVDDLKTYLESDGCLDPHLSDQIAPWLALAGGNASFTTTRISEHLVTSVWLLRQFLDAEISIQGETGRSGRVDFRRGHEVDGPDG